MITPEQQAQWQQYTQTSGYKPPQPTGGSSVKTNAYDLIDQSYQPPKPTITQKVGGYGADVVKNLGNTFKQGAENVATDIGNISKNAQEVDGGKLATGLAGLQAAGHVAGDVAGTAGNILGSFITPLLPESVKKGMGDVTKYIEDKVNSIPGMTPEIAKGLGDLFNTGSLLGGSKAEPIVTEATTQGVKDLGNQAIQTGKNIEEDTKGLIGKAKESIGNSMEARYTEQELKQWTKPVDTPKATYNKATEIYDNASAGGHNISKTLVGNKIRLSDNIENGVYNTADTADQLRADAGKASSEVLRPSLEVADRTVPKTNVEDIIKVASEDIKKSRGTPGDIETQLSQLNKEGAALARKYPTGMSLTEMHDNKITYSSGKYNPLGIRSDANAAMVDRAFGRTLGRYVEAKAPSGLPVREFNAELAKQYQAADYLEALNNKKVPKGLLSNIAKTTAKVTGAAVGHTIGGGVLGTVGGYHIGGMLESMVENMSNPIKTKVLSNLAKTNPEAFKAVQSYLSKSLDQSGSVAQPMSKQIINSTISSNDTTPKAGMSIGDVSKLHPEDKATLNDFLDYITGKYKPNPKEGINLEIAARRLVEKYGGNAEKGNKALANQINKTFKLR